MMAVIIQVVTAAVLGMGRNGYHVIATAIIVFVELLIAAALFGATMGN